MGGGRQEEELHGRDTITLTQITIALLVYD